MTYLQSLFLFIEIDISINRSRGIQRAKFRKYQLSWEASDSKTVIGYKLYWSKVKEVNYDSKYIKVGSIVDITLPNSVLLSDQLVIFGITAIDKDGNESDMTKMSEPFHVQMPKAPVRLSLEPLDEFEVLDSKKVVGTRLEQNSIDDPFADAIEHHGNSQTAKLKYYDDVGYPRR